MIKLLFRVRFRSLWYSMFSRSGRDGKKRSPVVKILLALLLVYALVAIIGTLAVFFHTLATVFAQAGQGWAYFALLFTVALAFGFIGSVFITQNQLFEAKDNELLLSMPIRPFAIVASRLLTITALNYLYSALILIPGGVVWCTVPGAEVNVADVVMYVVCCLALPLMTTSLSCFFGWLFALVTSRLRRKNLVTTIISFAFMFAYIYIYSNMGSFTKRIAQNSDALGGSIGKYLPPARFFGKASQGSVPDLLLFVLCCAVPFALVCFLLARTFNYFATGRPGAAAKKYKRGELRASGVRAALLTKELRRFFSLPVYIINSGLGPILEIALCVIVVIKRATILGLVSELGMSADIAAALICGGMGMCAAMTSTSSASISLEGGSLSVLKSMPLRGRDVLLVKALANFVIGAPCIIVAAAVIQFVIPMGIGVRIAMFVYPLAIQLFAGLFGILLNAAMPKLDWTNAAVVVKQSASVMLSVFAGMAVGIAPIVLGAFCVERLGVALFCAVVCIVFIAVCALLTLHIFRRGDARFAAL